MSSSDMAAFNELVRRVEVLESRVDLLVREISEKPPAAGDKDMMGELYGSEPDHSEDRAVRAALVPAPKPTNAKPPGR